MFHVSGNVRETMAAASYHSSRLQFGQLGLILNAMSGKFLVTALCVRSLAHEAIESIKVTMLKAAKKLGFPNLSSTPNSITSH